MQKVVGRLHVIFTEAASVVLNPEHPLNHTHLHPVKDPLVVGFLLQESLQLSGEVFWTQRRFTALPDTLLTQSELHSLHTHRLYSGLLNM